MEWEMKGRDIVRKAKAKLQLQIAQLKNETIVEI
jgi:hypothetical protein